MNGRCCILKIDTEECLKCKSLLDERFARYRLPNRSVLCVPCKILEYESSQHTDIDFSNILFRISSLRQEK